MGVPVLILGESGSGKSCSLRNFDPNEVGIFNVASKPLPSVPKWNFMPSASPAYSTAVAVPAWPKNWLRLHLESPQSSRAFFTFPVASS